MREVSESSHAKSKSKLPLYCCDCSLCSSSRLQGPCVGRKPMHCTRPTAVTVQSNAVQCSSTTFSPSKSHLLHVTCYLGGNRIWQRRDWDFDEEGGSALAPSSQCLQTDTGSRSAQADTVAAVSPSPHRSACHRHRCHLAGRISDEWSSFRLCPGPPFSLANWKLDCQRSVAKVLHVWALSLGCVPTAAPSMSMVQGLDCSPTVLWS